MKMFKHNCNIRVLVSVLGILICFDATAGVKLLPGSGASGNVRAKQGNPCAGYNLTTKKCDKKACAIGWDCLSCTNAKGTYYKCTQKSCDVTDGFVAGRTSCAPCQQYEYNGFAGNQICGKCSIINGCLENGNGDTYTTFQYVIGVTIKDDKVNSVQRTGYRLK
ncbi:MAG: hypothetical protein IJ677_05595 [Alphaproteobacteria bacterium]|nr:hypothetical protein [Alphaproteobacteria bacterium]